MRTVSFAPGETVNDASRRQLPHAGNPHRTVQDQIAATTIRTMRTVSFAPGETVNDASRRQLPHAGNPHRTVQDQIAATTIRTMRTVSFAPGETVNDASRRQLPHAGNPHRSVQDQIAAYISVRNSYSQFRPRRNCRRCVTQAAAALRSDRVDTITAATALC